MGLNNPHPIKNTPNRVIILPGWGCVTVSLGRALEWHSRGQRFDPAYLHQSGTVIIKLSDRKILKSYDFRIFSLLFLLKLFRLFWCLFGPCNRGCACNRPYQNLTRITMILQSLLCFYGHPDLFRRMLHEHKIGRAHV